MEFKVCDSLYHRAANTTQRAHSVTGAALATLAIQPEVVLTTASPAPAHTPRHPDGKPRYPTIVNTFQKTRHHTLQWFKPDICTSVFKSQEVKLNHIVSLLLILPLWRFQCSVQFFWHLLPAHRPAAHMWRLQARIHRKTLRKVRKLMSFILQSSWLVQEMSF